MKKKHRKIIRDSLKEETDKLVEMSRVRGSLRILNDLLKDIKNGEIPLTPTYKSIFCDWVEKKSKELEK